MAEDFDFKAFMVEFKEQMALWKDCRRGKDDKSDVTQIAIAIATACAAAIAASIAKSSCKNINQNGVSNSSSI